MDAATATTCEDIGMPIPWRAPFAFGTWSAPGVQYVKPENRIGGSAEGRRLASGASWPATCGSSWASRLRRPESRRVHGTTRYLLDGLSILAQYASDGTRQALYAQSPARIDEVLNVVNEDGKYWYQADALGSIYGLTDGTGALAARTGYDVFGSPMPPPPPGAGGGQPFGFTGREHDLDAGLVYARDRYVNPATGLWTQADRWRPFEETLDPARLIYYPAPYLYGGANPALFVDPLGFAITSVDKAILAMLARGSYRELILFLEAMGLTAMQRGQQIQRTLQQLIQSGTARILSGEATNAAYRVPDWLNRAKGILIELKFVNPCNMRVTDQLRDFARFAADETAAGRPTQLILLVRESDKIRPDVVSRLSGIGYRIIEIKDFVLQELETVKVIID